MRSYNGVIHNATQHMPAVSCICNRSVSCLIKILLNYKKTRTLYVCISRVFIFSVFNVCCTCVSITLMYIHIIYIYVYIYGIYYTYYAVDLRVYIQYIIFVRYFNKFPMFILFNSVVLPIFA